MTNQVGDPSTSSKLAAPGRLLRPRVAATYVRTRGIEGPRRLLGRLAARGLTAGCSSAPLLVPYYKEDFHPHARRMREPTPKKINLRTIDRSTIFPSYPRVPWRSFGGALAHCFQNQNRIRSFEVLLTVVFPSIDSIGYRPRPGSVLTTTEGRLHIFVRDVSGLKEDHHGPARMRMLMAAPAFGMSKPPRPFSSARDRIHFKCLFGGYPPVGRHRDRRVLAAPLPTIHAPRRALRRSLISSVETERPTDNCIARRAIVLLRVGQGRSEEWLHLTLLENWWPL